MITTRITDQPISIQSLIESVKADEAGAIASFCGDVRNNDREREVASLSYEVHPTAQKVLQELTERIGSRHDIVHVAVMHRFGEIPIGDTAFAVAVSAVHRGPALAACDEIVNTVKDQLPIWKYQVFADGTSEWVNSA
jgi:molybdopterin synthase catalytic subunit